MDRKIRIENKIFLFWAFHKKIFTRNKKTWQVFHFFQVACQYISNILISVYSKFNLDLQQWGRINKVSIQKSTTIWYNKCLKVNIFNTFKRKHLYFDNFAGQGRIREGSNSYWRRFIVVSTRSNILSQYLHIFSTKTPPI